MQSIRRPSLSANSLELGPESPRSLPLLAALFVLPLAIVGCDEDGALDIIDEPGVDFVEGLPVIGLGDDGPEVAELYDYLHRYGYFPNAELAKHLPGWTPVIDSELEDAEMFDAALEEALLMYQQAHGLPATGRLDQATRALMQQPRCGFPDYYPPRPSVGSAVASALGKQSGATVTATATASPSGPTDLMALPIDPSAYVASPYRWPYLELSFGFTVHTSDTNATFQRNAVLAAMKTWSDVVPVAWVERSDPDVRIAWVPRKHGDGSDFSWDTYAHAFYPSCSPSYGAFSCDPIVGDVHFNDADYHWGKGNGGSVQDIQTIALHELGHALGLDHSPNKSAVMFATASLGAVRHNLSQDDINGIRAMYPAYRDLRIFELWWYFRLNPDLVKAFGWDVMAASFHWLSHGRHEGRRASPAFDVRYYMQTHPDLVQAFGANNWSAALWHWRDWGLKEGRRSSPAFDPKYYLGKYPDLVQAFGPNNYGAAVVHWLEYGIKEGRRGSLAFDPKYYLQANPGVAQEFGANNYTAAVYHWLVFGIKEGSKGAP